MWRYQISDRIQINAPIDRVFEIASDPELVPSYAHEIDHIEMVERIDRHRILVKSYIKLAGYTWASLYEFHYHPPELYSGVQKNHGLVRGYFNFRFQSLDGVTTVVHTEGILSSVPFLAWVAGFTYFRILSRGGMSEELLGLKRLAELPNV